MDASAVLSAIVADDMVTLFRLIHAETAADQWEEIISPVTGETGVFARFGTVNVSATPTGVTVHNHDDVESAVTCFDRKIQLIREMVDYAAQLVTVPNDLSGM